MYPIPASTVSIVNIAAIGRSQRFSKLLPIISVTPQSIVHGLLQICDYALNKPIHLPENRIIGQRLTLPAANLPGSVHYLSGEHLASLYHGSTGLMDSLHLKAADALGKVFTAYRAITYTAPYITAPGFLKGTAQYLLVYLAPLDSYIGQHHR